MTKRKDSKGRILLKGESQRDDGRYTYKYQDNGKSKFVYSWRLTESDPLPKGKRPCKSLREIEKVINRDIEDGIDTSGQKMTLWQLYEKHIALKSNVRKRTVISRKLLLEQLKADTLGNMPIGKIRPSDVKQWAVRMKEKKYSYQTIENQKISLKACFETAIADDLIRKNPCLWDLDDVIVNDTKKKEILTEKQKHDLLSFASSDKVYYKYYDAIVILLNTGLRISELCGLTVSDIDFKSGVIKVNHQLAHDKDGYYIMSPKTENGIRNIPMLPIVRDALKNAIKSRVNMQDVKIDGYSDFIFLNKKGYPLYSVIYSNMFSNMVKKYNKHHEEDMLPPITPHTLRHTFCTEMANKKMTPHNLQYIMGHKNITMTLGYYTHASAQTAMAEMLSIA